MDHPRPTERRDGLLWLLSAGRGAGATSRAQEQLATCRDRELGREIGRCAVCAKAVRSQQHSVRRDGVLVHVYCRHPRGAGESAST